jgi:hypothetical protein
MFSLRGAAEQVNMRCLCSQIPKFFAARQNKYSFAFDGKFRNFSLGGEQNTVLLFVIPKNFSTWLNKMQSI